MSGRSDRPAEYAMTHFVGAGGRAERYARPPEVRTIAERVQRWVATQEICKSCSRLPAVFLRDEMALCGRCREQADLRFMRVIGTFERTRVERADTTETPDEQLRGYAIVVNKRSVDLGFFIEIIKPEALDRFERERPDLRYLWNHNTDITLGRISAGTLRAKRTTRGLYVEVDPPQWAGAYIETVQRRDVTGQSFAFFALTDEWHLEDGMPVREVLDMEIFEGSGVSFPAYPDTTLEVVGARQRSGIWQEEQSAERLRLAKS